MRRPAGPPWAALLALKPTTGSLRLLRKLARATIQIAVRNAPTLREAAKELGITERALVRLRQKRRRELFGGRAVGSGMATQDTDQLPQGIEQGSLESTRRQRGPAAEGYVALPGEE